MMRLNQINQQINQTFLNRSAFGNSLERLRKWIALISPMAVLTANVMVALPVNAVEFPSTGDRGAPGRTAGGGTRGGWCEHGMWTPEAAMALVPGNNVSTFAGDQASLSIYISDMFDHKRAEVYVQHAQTRETVYHQQLTLTGLEEGGIVKMLLPSTDGAGGPLLAVEEDYFWEVAIICDVSDRTRDYTVQGFLRRQAVGADFLEEMATAAPTDQVERYAEAALWQETLQTAETLQGSEPETWHELLLSVGLGNLPADNWVECCQLVQTEEQETANATTR
ncbi:MAG: DUF928 domain-containing protein [Cyanobacteria bacterium J06623_5]